MKCNSVMPGSLIQYGSGNIFYLVTYLNKDRMNVIRITDNDKQTKYRNFSIEDRFNNILK